MGIAKIRLVGIDVDGTLVGASGLVPPAVWDAARRARELGIHLALCSGRPAFGVALEYARRLEPTGWHVFQNGASIVNLTTGQSRSAPIAAEWIGVLIQQARETGETLELYGDTAYVTESPSRWAQQHAQLLGTAFDPRPFESMTQPVVRAQWLLSPERARDFTGARYPGLEVAQSGSPLMPDTRFVGLTHGGITKGSAIRGIAEEYAISLEDVMYVGDSGNDLSALRIVGYPVAMANADTAVLAASKLTVGHVDHGGLSQALEMALELR